MSTMYAEQRGMLVAAAAQGMTVRATGVMRFEGIHITARGVELGQAARAPWMVRRRDALAVVDARRTRQRFVCVADVSGPGLVVRAGRKELRCHELATGESASIGLHLHASTCDRPDYWSPACFVLNQLAIANCGMAWDISAMSNSVEQALELTIGLLHRRPDLDAALITAGDRFDGIRFGGRYGRYKNDHWVLRGDAGGGVVVSRTLGVASLVSAATRTDPKLKNQ